MRSVLWEYGVDLLFIKKFTYFQHLIGLWQPETAIFFAADRPRRSAPRARFYPALFLLLFPLDLDLLIC